MTSFIIGFLYTALILLSLFLICLVLIQRGKGGGLAGAFGAVGGSSAFGTKAGDVFTRVTIGVAAVWFLLNMVLVVISNRDRVSAFDAGITNEAPISPGGASKDKVGGAGSTTPGDSGAIPPPPITDRPSAPKTNSSIPSALDDVPPAKPDETAKPK